MTPIWWHMRICILEWTSGVFITVIFTVPQHHVNKGTTIKQRGIQLFIKMCLLTIQGSRQLGTNPYDIQCSKAIWIKVCSHACYIRSDETNLFLRPFWHYLSTPADWFCRAYVSCILTCCAGIMLALIDVNGTCTSLCWTLQVDWFAVDSPVFQRGFHRWVSATKRTRAPPNQETSRWQANSVKWILLSASCWQLFPGSQAADS